MKATLTFDLPEERAEFEDAARAGDYRGALDTFREYLRAQLKHVEPERRDDMDGVQARFHETLAEYGIDL